MIDVNPASGPGGFQPGGHYDFRFATKDDPTERLRFTVTFGTHDSDGGQPLELRRLDGEDARNREAAGIVLTRGRTSQVIEGAQGVRVWAGSRADPFFINGEVVRVAQDAIRTGKGFDVRAIDYGAAANAFAGKNVCAIVLEIPDDVFDFEEIAALSTDSGGYLQINRCGNPLVISMFFADDSSEASNYNAGTTSERFHRDRNRFRPWYRQNSRLTCPVAGFRLPLGTTHDGPLRHI